MFDWSDEHKMLQDAIRDFVQKEIVPVHQQLEYGDLAPYDVLRKFVRCLRHRRHGPGQFQRTTGSGRVAIDVVDSGTGRVLGVRL